MKSRGFEFPPRPYPEVQKRLEGMLSQVRWRRWVLDLDKPLTGRRESWHLLTDEERVAIAQSPLTALQLAEAWRLSESYVHRLRKNYREKGEARG
jgi:hypothetical protein